MNKPEILIVEDDKAIKNLISTTLELEGYRYHTAENGAQAILSAATQQPDIMSVSYTHLDVYKRQLQYSVTIISHYTGVIFNFSL